MILSTIIESVPYYLFLGVVGTAAAFLPKLFKR